MAIANLTREVALVDSDFLGMPYNHHISDDGYWYTYHPSDLDSNNVKTGNSIQPYQWDSGMPVGASSQLATNSARVELDGTIAFMDDSHGTGTLRYHGGTIMHIGSGVNDITGLTENDAYMFSHIGSYGDSDTPSGSLPSGTLQDDAFYWDRLYQENAGGPWDFYQYHKHLPSNYSKYDDGRVVFDADGYIREADKQYGYLINILAKDGGSTYSVPLARIHTPSVGGAHNSHNDVTLPNTAGVNYLPGGILKGASNRFHAFYLEDAGASGWNIYSRTYTSTSASFTPEVNYGSYTIADPKFDPYPGGNEYAGGTSSEYTLRASAGHTFGSKVYVPVIMDAVARSYTSTVTNIVGGGVVYAMTTTDRDGAKAEANQPDINILVGDTLTLNNSQYLAHPMSVQDNFNLGGAPADEAAGSSGNGTVQVTFTPVAAGTYYYVCNLHSNMYGQINVGIRTGKFDQQIWSFTDANTISPGTLNRMDLPFMFQGTEHKPDTYITSVGTNMYIAAAGGIQGGIKLFSANTIMDSAGALSDEGFIVTNDSDDHLRLHGFKYNPTNTKFYNLISGPLAAPGTYSGRGLYSFDLAGGAFSGYEHLAYDSATGAFKNKPKLQQNYLSFNHSTATIEHVPGLEPEGIPSGTSILQWDLASPQFFNKKEITTGAEEYYFQGIYLADGRKALVGRVEGFEGTTGGIKTGDLLLTIVDNENDAVSYTFGGTGDDFVTGIIEDKENNKIVLSGYAKGELTMKGDQWVHGWGRNIHQANDSAACVFYDVIQDSVSTHYHTIGADNIAGRPILNTYDRDYTHSGSYFFDIGGESDQLNSVDNMSGQYGIFSGYTKNQTSETDGLITKLKLSDNTIAWSKRVFQATKYNKITDHCVITKNNQEYIVGFVENNNISEDSAGNQLDHGILFLMDDTGNITTSKTTEAISHSGPGANSNLHIKRIKPGKKGTGDFFFCGSDTQPIWKTRTGAWGYGNVLSNNLVNYIALHSSTGATQTLSDSNNDTNLNNEECAFNDISMISYDSDTRTYEVVVVGKTEDVSLAAGVTEGGMMNAHRSFPYAEKNTIITQDAGSVHNVTTNWNRRYVAGHGQAEEINSVLVEDSINRPWYKFETDFHHNGEHRIIMAGHGTNLDSDGAHQDYTGDILMRRDTFFLGVSDNDGDILKRQNVDETKWANSLGHMGFDDINKSMIWDKHYRNLVVVGSSTSHSIGEDGILFRLDKEGWGTGVYHTDVSTSNAYYYDSCLFTSQVETAYINSRDSATFPSLSLSSITYSDITISMQDNTARAVATEYNGSYGANGLFTGFLAIVDQGELQTFKNTDNYIKDTQSGKTIHRAENLFNIHQISTVGDATADDGNVFAYDVIKSTDGEYYYIDGQVSGNISKTNTGQSGVYDYFIGQWDIASSEFRLWQNGTAVDEEVFALTELTGTSKAVTNPEAVNNGATVGTISWTPTVAGTYVYQCGNHSNMNGQIVVSDTQAGIQTFDIGAVQNGTFQHWNFTGSDRNGVINPAANDPIINIDTGDTINVTIGSHVGVHPFWIQTATGTGGAKKGHIAFCGRTTGQLAADSTDTPVFGGYDIFLGIFDPRAWSAEYYNMGSGFNDKGMNLHDIHDKVSDTLAIVYTSFGSVNSSTTFGSEDIGIVTFNYDTDVWSQGFQTGSETSEEIEQNGKCSTKLQDGRIAVVCNTAGTFADNAETYGLKDMGLGIFDFDSDGSGSGNYLGWKKYQIGSGSTDFSFSVDNNGSTFLITGYSEATWDKGVSGVFVEFDPERNFKGKSA